ncbi:MAG TPA: hypothetical protein DIW43_12565 [Spongiibacteraceae bacterium]|nr:hypothetical protein [Spongiibacteraceae bacterium]HCS28283.1 hypothetical protein [Spongiibacteraceae bacterium]
MDYLFGCAADDGAKLVERMESMEAATRTLGYGPAVKFSGKGVAFAVAASRGRPAPEHRLAKVGNWVVAFSGFLYNERELAARLHLEVGADDAAIVAHGLAERGPEFARDMNGDWTCVVFNKADGSLHLLRDQTGSSSLLYRHNEGSLTFGTTVHAFVATDRLSVSGQFLIASQYPRGMPYDLTVYAGVKMLRAAHRLDWSGAGLSLHHYWQPAIAAIRYDRLEDYDAHFCELYAKVVEDRVRRVSGGVGLTLSGGFDSGSVGVWAGDAMARHHPGEALQTYSYVPYDVEPGSVLDERPAINAALAACGKARGTIIDGHEISLVQSIRAMYERQIEPHYAAISQLYLYRATAAAQADGVSLLLTGQMGNATVSRAVAIELALEGRGQPRPSSWSEWRQRSLHGIAVSFLPKRVRAALYRRRLPRPRFEPSLMLHPDFQGSTERLMHWTGTDMAGLEQHFKQHGSDSNARMHLGNGRLMRFWAGMSASCEMYTSDPTIDPRLVEFCLNIPLEVFGVNPNADRQLIRRAMAHRMPREVLERKRVNQGSDISRRIQREADELAAMVAELAADPLVREWWDMDRVAAVLRGNINDKQGAALQIAQSRALVALRAAYWMHRVGSVA